jgi:hypothetical protein
VRRIGALEDQLVSKDVQVAFQRVVSELLGIGEQYLHRQQPCLSVHRVTHLPSAAPSTRSVPAAAALRGWSPSIITGLLQTEGYARALLATLPGAGDETVAARLDSRMQRQHRVLLRDIPPSACFLVDELSLYRRVGSPEDMAAQLRRLLEVAATARVIVQVLPAVAHPVNASGFLMADSAVWIEHAAGGFTYTDDETVAALAVRFDTLRSESYRASESAALIERLAGTWAAGGHPLTQTPTAATA